MRIIGCIVAAAALALAWGNATQAQDAEAGAKIFKRFCAVCHTVEPGKNRVGPTLHGVYGRTAGSVENFKYSEAMKEAGWTWDEEHLDKYLANPKETVPGNKMIFAGVKKDDERKNLISYLETVK
ncbi:MAG TPA: cytochrome c family protein [Geminicoccus sp.]|uniref:c-type cytochrome n=1 Tax=Geminicoccus sp. TaxID=2024832 RepID=UPI002CB82FC3|nr:cytochrome c family protein [Geminicoccus sp.]HWL71646.1 cytochrome c family protein [Geminicoccus sp.]